MIRRPPISTRTYTRFPFPTLVRSSTATTVPAVAVTRVGDGGLTWYGGRGGGGGIAKNESGERRREERLTGRASRSVLSGEGRRVEEEEEDWQSTRLKSSH